MLKNQKNVPVALLTLSLFLIILAEPVLAKRGRPRSGKLPRDSLRSRQFAKPGRHTTRITKTAFDATKHARGSFDAGKHARGSFDAGNLTRRRRHRYQRHRKDGFSFSLNLGSSHLTRRHHYRRRFRHHRSWMFHRIVWPTYRRIVYYNHGPHFTFRYVYPYHHRKYVFVSLGGYWPLGYRYVRYYRYGYHPYYWYGSYPAIYEVEGDTYNYYTYNYGSDTTGEVTDYTKPVDANTFADVRERLAAQAARKPAPETPADRCFEDAVKAFEAGDYDTAADKFADALDLATDDMVLPFAYVQALFADQQYSKAVEVLREALAQLPPDKEGVFYPRGLYPDDDMLFEQIGRLAAKVELDPSDEDLQLLLGYQLLGAGKLDRAVELLQQVSPNSENTAPAAKLLELLEKIRAENAEDNDP